MTDGKGEGQNSSRPERTEDSETHWKRFKDYHHKESGVHISFDKSGSTYSPSIGFEHSRGGYITRHGRIMPNFQHDIADFNPIRFIIEALTALEGDINRDLREESAKDKARYLQRQKDKAEERKRRKEEARQNKEASKKRSSGKGRPPSRIDPKNTPTK